MHINVLIRDLFSKGTWMEGLQTTIQENQHFEEKNNLPDIYFTQIELDLAVIKAKCKNILILFQTYLV